MVEYVLKISLLSLCEEREWGCHRGGGEYFTFLGIENTTKRRAKFCKAGEKVFDIVV